MVPLPDVAFLLLLVFTTMSPDPVSGGCWFCKKPCTKTQKNYIIVDICCKEVRTLQSNGEGMMQCLVDLLARQERVEYDVTVMLYLKTYCTQPPFPVPPHHEVMV
ncbi:hypothetical protein GQ55_8G064400 [Panicum hallii var. hallii]|uniref:Hydrophobic seed protein domain-containing protein n=1 Tax=Panicum hallii var. hallii TaxID=1504633 RepID=A0A2T7CL96_9POAL|nr:hypothetical protein GQ55_8G064400 [Panicum hallii var. hallii]